MDGGIRKGQRTLRVHQATDVVAMRVRDEHVRDTLRIDARGRERRRQEAGAGAEIRRRAGVEQQNAIRGLHQQRLYGQRQFVGGLTSGAQHRGHFVGSAADAEHLVVVRQFHGAVVQGPRGQFADLERLVECRGGGGFRRRRLGGDGRWRWSIRLLRTGSQGERRDYQH
jgi:hypothetical protein